MITAGSWGYWGGRTLSHLWCPVKALACSSAAFTCTEHWNTLRCYSGITKETWLCTKSRAGAMLAAYGYFLSFCKAAELEAPCGRWNVPGAAGTCLRRRNARKTQHAALAAVCIRPPSGGRQLLMLLSRCNVTFSSLLLLLFHWPSFLSAVALLFPPRYFPTSGFLKWAFLQAKTYCQNNPRVVFFLVSSSWQTLLLQRSPFFLFFAPRYSVELISPLILQMRYSRNNQTNISSVRLNLGYINRGYRGESDPENLGVLFYWRANKIEGWWLATGT